jgi:DNA-binding NarL/FixJ family response regulator
VRLLWVENHDVFARMAGRQFLAAHDLTVVPSIAAAKTALATQPFEAVLLDYDLDDGKGSELMESIRRLPTRIAVIATSSHETGNAALMAAGADIACPKARFSTIETALRLVVRDERTGI